MRFDEQDEFARRFIEICRDNSLNNDAFYEQIANLVLHSEVISKFGNTFRHASGNSDELFRDVLSDIILKLNRVRVSEKIGSSGICGYLFVSLRNNLIRELKKNRTQSIPSLEDFENVEISVCDDVHKICHVLTDSGNLLSLSVLDLREAIEKVEQGSRMEGICLRLALGEMSQVEIANLLGISPCKAGRHIRKAKRRFKKILEQDH